MSDTLIVLHTAIAIIVIVLLILVVRVDPVISLVIGPSTWDSQRVLDSRMKWVSKRCRKKALPKRNSSKRRILLLYTSRCCLSWSRCC